MTLYQKKKFNIPIQYISCLLLQDTYTFLLSCWTE